MSLVHKRTPINQVRDTDPTPTPMHSKHAEPNAMTGPTQPPPTTSEPPRVDSVEMGCRRGCELQRLHWRGDAGYTKPQARRPVRTGKKKQKGKQRPASFSSMAGGCPSSCLCFVFVLLVSAPREVGCLNGRYLLGRATRSRCIFHGRKVAECNMSKSNQIKHKLIFSE
jgi:hypothetical protein